MSRIVYIPDAAVLQRLAQEADVRERVVGIADDWDSRQPLTPPGLVWSVPSDTCMTGRTEAPDNVAYDEFGAEFVFRQPRNEQELAAVMRASRVEVFDCYRFDGLNRWSPESATAWLENVHVIEGWLENALARRPDVEILRGLRAYLDYIRSGELGHDVRATIDCLTSNRRFRSEA